MEINSLQNKKIKDIILLRKPARRKKQNLIIVEGLAEIKMAQSAGFEIESLFLCPKYSGGREKKLKTAAEKIFKTSPSVFKKISIRQNPDGFLAIIKRPSTELKNIKVSSSPLLLVLEKVEKPGNLGAVLRTAEAAGIDAVLFCDSKTDVFSPNVIRASLGAVFAVPLAVCGNQEAHSWLKKKKIKIFASTPSAKIAYEKINFKQATAILVGAEHEGLSDFWLSAADQKIKLPLRGKIDSLNASVSAAVLVYEALRQRNIG